MHVDGELVFTKSMLGRYPDPDDVVPLLRDKLGGEAPRADPLRRDPAIVLDTPSYNPARWRM